jgi:hypothetical protein
MAAPAPFLGVVEEETAKVVARRVLDVRVMPNFKADSVMINEEKQTEMFLWLCEKQNCVVSLYVTDRYLKQYIDEFKINDMRVYKAVNMEKSRQGRTILEVSIGENDFKSVLKCVEERIAVSRYATELEVVTKTTMQQEVNAFDNLPPSLKLYFVQKLAHGRIWFRIAGTTKDISFETILMAMCFPNDVSYTLWEMSQTDKGTALKLWAKAIRTVQSVHTHGYAHGDANLSNFLFSYEGLSPAQVSDFEKIPGISKFAGRPLKMIDPERMQELTKFVSNEENSPNGMAYVNLYLMNDFYEIIFKHILFGCFNGQYNGFTRFDQLQVRMQAIYDRLEDHLKKDFYLHDCIIFDYSQIAMAAARNHVELFGQLQKKHPTRCQIIASKLLDIDVFLGLLCEPSYLHKNVTYLLGQIERMKVTTEIIPQDLIVPSIMPQVPIVNNQPAPHVQPVAPSSPPMPEPAHPGQKTVPVRYIPAVQNDPAHPPGVPEKYLPAVPDAVRPPRGHGIFPHQQPHQPIPMPPPHLSPLPPHFIPGFNPPPVQTEDPDTQIMLVPSPVHMFPMPHQSNVTPVVHFPPHLVPLQIPTCLPLIFEGKYVIELYLGQYCPLYYYKPNAISIQVYVRHGGQFHVYPLPLQRIIQIFVSGSESHIVAQHQTFNGHILYYRIEGVHCITYVNIGPNQFKKIGTYEI